MRILLLAPIYALVSWSMMVFLPVAPYIEVLRDVYETYTIYCFWIMLVLWCGGQRRVVDVLDRLEVRSFMLCPLLNPFGCGLQVWRFAEGKSMFRYALPPGSHVHAPPHQLHAPYPSLNGAVA